MHWSVISQHIWLLLTIAPQSLPRYDCQNWNWYCQISLGSKTVLNWETLRYSNIWHVLRSCLPSSLASWVTVTKKFWKALYESQGGGPLRSPVQEEPSGRVSAATAVRLMPCFFSQLMIQHNGNTRAGPFSAQNGTSQICNIYSSFPWPGWASSELHCNLRLFIPNPPSFSHFPHVMT